MTASPAWLPGTQEPGWNDRHSATCSCSDCREAAEDDEPIARYSVQADGSGYWQRLAVSYRGQTVREVSWLPVRHRAIAVRDAEKQLERLVEGVKWAARHGGKR